MNRSYARKPRCIVLVNETRIAWHDVEINSNRYFQADSFHITALVEYPAAKITRDWWSAQTSMDVKIYIGFADNENYTTNDLDLMFMGSVDNAPDSLTSNTISLTGRDYSSFLIETKTTQKWQNHTASEIATLLAKRHNLIPVVTPTKKKVGTYYQIDHTRLTSDSSEWNVLAALAREEGFQLYVDRNELHFEPKPANSPSYTIMWKDSLGDKVFEGVDLSFDRYLTLAKDIIVNVRSWNNKHKKGFTKTAKATHTRDKLTSSINRNVGQPQIFSYRIPNLTPERAQQIANERLREITLHQMKMTANGMPADNILTVRHIINVSGTGSNLYDQSYHPDSIIRRISLDSGYTMDVVAKNHDTNSEIIL